jgi:toxin YoeB
LTLIAFTPNAWEDYLYWQKRDKAKLRRINLLIRDACRDPASGIGKPEALRFDLSGYYSRRIDHEHRLVYSFDSKLDMLKIVQCRYHYQAK